LEAILEDFVDAPDREVADEKWSLWTGGHPPGPGVQLDRAVGS